MLYELATLSCPLLAVGRSAARVMAWARRSQSTGRLLGCWRTDSGSLGRVLVLRGFETRDGLAEDRRSTLMSDNPFDAGGVITAFEADSYGPFPFLPAIRTGDRGGVYEFRTYRLKPGGLPPTLAGWQSAIEPARDYTDHLVVNLYALDGAPRITHIWGFASLEERRRLRSQAYDAGVWPPKGGPEQIIDAVSTIALPEDGSPLF